MIYKQYELNYDTLNIMRRFINPIHSAAREKVQKVLPKTKIEFEEIQIDGKPFLKTKYNTLYRKVYGTDEIMLCGLMAGQNKIYKVEAYRNGLYKMKKNDFTFYMYKELENGKLEIYGRLDNSQNARIERMKLLDDGTEVVERMFEGKKYYVCTNNGHYFAYECTNDEENTFEFVGRYERNVLTFFEKVIIDGEEYYKRDNKLIYSYTPGQQAKYVGFWTSEKGLNASGEKKCIAKRVIPVPPVLDSSDDE